MKRIYLFIATFSMLWLGSCDSLLDVNEDPSRFSPDEATLGTLLPSAIRYTATSIYGAQQYGTQYTQHMAGSAIGQYTPYGFDALWIALYTDAFPTLQEIIKRGEEAGAYNYTAVAKTLLALNVMVAADIYGDIPYSQANQGPANLYPCYDPMQEVYNVHIIELLDEALADYAKPKPVQVSLQTLQNDFAYAGDIKKWEKATRAIRARYYLHLSKKDPTLLTKAVEEANLAFTSNAEDLQLVYDDVTRNPWNLFVGAATNKTVQPSAYLVDMLNGKNIFQNAVDPRLAIYVTKAAATATYSGLPAGTTYSSSASFVNVTASNWPFQITAPVIFISYAEMQFILAEAQFATDKPAAYAAYRKGVEASMLKAGVPAATATTYLANPEISMGDVNLTLADIMLQKYMALYLQTEVWTDMRRYQYNPAIYPGLQKPTTNILTGNPWIQRSKLADEEPGVNTCIPESKTQDVPLWLFE
jgi:hypothetical protein